MPSHTAIVVSHTHWDREWYQTFQQFRMRLVDMVDVLLDLLARDPDFQHFMMDGQTIVLDDYTEVRPERCEELAGHIRAGRISIGPWYVLPDEALVSGEALIRNLMAGERTARPWGPVMALGYLPDTFGHINQLPQIARGWGLQAVVITRGVPDSPCEFLWDGPDGVPILAINLRQSYGNALYLYPDEHLVPRVKRMVAELSAHATTPYLLFMNGGDHHFPETTIPEALYQANVALPDLELVHGSLEQFVDAVVEHLSAAGIETRLARRVGEMRDHQMHYLLPGVLSTRMWIKQRNAACQRLLERWAEPLAAWACLRGGRDRRPFLRQAWRYLLQNHPHDSICGCSIDQVHEEMVPRFDWVEQIADRVIDEGMHHIAAHALATSGRPDFRIAVFNSEDGPRTDAVTAELEMPTDGAPFALRDEETGAVLPVEILDSRAQETFSFVVGPEIALLLLGEMGDGQLVDKRIRTMSLRRDGDTVHLDFLAAGTGGADPDELVSFLARIEELARTGGGLTFRYEMRYPPLATVRFLAEGLPPMGYKVYTVIPAPASAGPVAPPAREPEIANERFTVRASPSDGTLTLVDRAFGRTFTGLNRFVDGGDAGDEYNYSPPLEQDRFVTAPARPPQITVDRGLTAEAMHVCMAYRVPAALGSGRATRSEDLVELPVETTVTLYPGVPRVEIETRVENRAHDHRLRVHFPTSIHAAEAWTDAAFDVLSRPIGTPTHGQDWQEQPVATWPQQGFADVHDATGGLMVAADGLPEVEVLRGDDGDTIALTLLRSVGWLSRGDLLTRRANAGPTLPTPEAQCLGLYTFRYALIPHRSRWEQAFLAAHRFLSPLRALQLWGGPPERTSHSLVAASPAQVVVSAVKLPEDGEPALVLRVYNPLDRPVNLDLALGLPFERAELVDLRERPAAGLPGVRFDPPGYFGMRLGAKRIQTIRFSQPPDGTVERVS
jgi:alpha-mannosidase